MSVVKNHLDDLPKREDWRRYQRDRYRKDSLFRYIVDHTLNLCENRGIDPWYFYDVIKMADLILKEREKSLMDENSE